jgi:hypothetical protein
MLSTSAIDRVQSFPLDEVEAMKIDRASGPDDSNTDFMNVKIVCLDISIGGRTHSIWSMPEADAITLYVEFNRLKAAERRANASSSDGESQDQS